MTISVKDYKKVKVIMAILFVLGCLLLCSFMVCLTVFSFWGIFEGLSALWSFLVACDWWFIFTIPLGILSLTVGLFALGVMLVFGMSGILIFISSLTVFNRLDEESSGVRND